jgi:cardiolipin synthase
VGAWQVARLRFAWTGSPRLQPWGMCHKSPSLLHAKHLSVDDDIAVIGSSNLDLRSFTLNLEVTLICCDKSVAAMQPVFQGYLTRSKKLYLHEWVLRSPITRLAESIARLTAALQ